MDDKPEADVVEQFQPVDGSEIEDDAVLDTGDQLGSAADADPADLADQRREVPHDDPDEHA